MDKDSFNRLSIDEQLSYYNKGLEQGGSIVSISKAIGVSESTIRSRFKSNGYKYNDLVKQIVEIGSDLAEKDAKEHRTGVGIAPKVIESDDVQRTNSIKSTDDNSSGVGITDVTTKTDDISQSLIISNKLKENIIDLAENHEGLIEMLNWFNSNDRSMTNVIEVIKQGIKIDLPHEKNVDYRTTIRVNDVVWKEFQAFCKEHGEYTQKDLLSQALSNFMRGHK